MAICEWMNCKGTYEPTKSWQRFCSTKCHDDWHYHQKKLAQLAVADELRELRLANGNGAAEGNAKQPLSDLLKTLRPAEPKQPMFRRV